MLLITGLSGVGKTFTIASATSRDATFVRLSGSSILQKIGRPTTGLTVAAVEANQIAIAAHLAEMSEQERKYCILDGHAVIETSDCLWPVPISIIQAIGVIAVVVIFDSVSELVLRRASKGKTSTLMDVQSLQEFEIQRSQTIAEHIRVPFHAVRSGDAKSLLRFLHQVTMPDDARSH